MFKVKKLEPSIVVCIITIIIVSIFTTGVMFYFSLGSIDAIFEFLSDNPLLMLLNFLPIPLVMLLIYFISGNCVVSTFIPMLIFIAGSFANEIKIVYRQDPVIPSDLSVLGEVKSIISKYGDTYVNLCIAAIVITILIIVIAFVFFRRSSKLTLKKRLVCGICTLACFLGLFCTVYSDSDLYDSFAVDGNEYFKVNHYASKGFLYSFIYDINNLRVNKPSKYSTNEFINTDISVDYSKFEKVSKPNIVMIMSEAFTDISNAEGIDFSRYGNPLKFYNSFIKRNDVVSGHIVVPNYGGGTSDTEFDVLTGCSTKFIDSSQVSYNLIRKPMDAIPSLLKNVGYDTLAIHPGYSWFYNRINVYDMIGFDDFLYLEKNFDADTQSRGGYISDEAATQSIIENFEKHIEESDAPLFEFCVTIQNHGPYDEKYNDYVSTLDTNFDSDINLTEEEKAIYSGYFEGIDDADAQIEDLVKYFSKSDEPVVLVFFGDHLPSFTNGMDYFEDFMPEVSLNGSLEQQMNAYETPFFIWANKAAIKTTNFAENAEHLQYGNKNTISSYYLGAMLMELLDMGDISMLFDYVNNMRRDTPVCSVNWNMDSEGNVTDKLNDEKVATIDKYKRWIYYKMFDQY